MAKKRESKILDTKKADRHLSSVALRTLAEADRSRFKASLQEAFTAAAFEKLGSVPEPIPSDDDLERSLAAQGAVAYDILADGVVVGGAIVGIDPNTHHNSLDFLFLVTREQGNGLGQKAWLSIERRHPETKVWVTHTPYFEKRNIHFYVNRCGFKIVEYYSERWPDPHRPDEDMGEEDEGMFRLEKAM